MVLKPVDVVENISGDAFKKKYFQPQIPLVIKGLSKQWPAYTKWNWDYFKSIVGNQNVGIYNNVKSDAYTPINKADDYKTFGEYIDMIRSGPAAWVHAGRPASSIQSAAKKAAVSVTIMDSGNSGWPEGPARMHTS